MCVDFCRGAAVEVLEEMGKGIGGWGGRMDFGSEGFEESTDRLMQ